MWHLTDTDRNRRRLTRKADAGSVPVRGQTLFAICGVRRRAGYDTSRCHSAVVAAAWFML
jgi:hypothetical protein